MGGVLGSSTLDASPVCSEAAHVSGSCTAPGKVEIASGSSQAAPSAPVARPTRPPPLRFDRGAAWPELALGAEVEAARATLGARPAEELRMVTWNVWFDDLQAHHRQLALMRELLQHAPDVVSLQEVLPGFADALRRSTELQSLYAISPNGVGHYGCLMLVRKDLRPTFKEQELPSNMGRKLVWAECAERHPGLVVMTTHLESLNTAPYRRKQLEAAARLLRGRPLSVLCGDFNFDDTKTWGDWRRKEPAVGPDKLENTVLQQVLPSFADAWRAVHPTDPGYTFDGETNPANCHDQGERMRYDRMMVGQGSRSFWARGPHLVPRGAELLGTREIADWGLKPSDHYGLLVDMALSQ